MCIQCRHFLIELVPSIPGLNDIVPDNLLSIFDENELEVRIWCTMVAMQTPLVLLVYV